MIPANHKRLRSVLLAFLSLTTLGIALLCQPPLIASATDVTTVTCPTNVIGVTCTIDINGTIIPLLKCYVGSCGMESQSP